MGLCFKISVFIAIIAAMIGIGPVIYKNMDNRKYNRRSTAEEAADSNNFKDKTVIVTGASSGIGIPTAKVLYENGANVIMACRNEGKANKVREGILQETATNTKLDESNLKVMALDLASLKSVDNFVKQFEKSYKRLNILINNAGIMGLDDYTLSADGIEAQFATNNLGHFYLTERLTPLLKKSASATSISRVINTASVAYMGAPGDIKSWLINEDKLADKNEYAPMQQYGLTKACNIIYGKEYNKRNSKDNVYSLSLHPGAIKSGLQAHNTYLNIWNKYWPAEFGLKSASQGAATQIRAAAMPEMDFKSIAGRYMEDCNVAELWRSDIIDDEKSNELGPLLYTLSEKILKDKGFSL
mmetsp:Transcript_33066/g.28979  ORF Transcript_33066/g.28979 Transcript_33066/m.28979 type:complete len:357 (+) Transcript_33066:84-1154(+)|eukprot:CAMPEP_0201594996 /NCGR_PEP_ID=MMETSP0190_2-20130828/192141_1 /ASSEMBLY_ACC=CAM_ASM_000263 /TAXON_ID=37353 /ORGANISM="Rosalina sp." /LENGTH=356 /DNA_ID=CAMNT_0048054823 /DNA_START=96 /DNA_END=1166 /DNA_ORIENTATION=-